MSAVVLDTNVLVFANMQSGDSPDPDCVRNSRERIVQSRNEIVVIDSNGEIRREYMRQVDVRGHPTFAGEYIIDLLRNIGNPSRFEQGPITNTNGSYREFPTDPELESFDRSDRKFVCVALRSRNSPVIAVSSDRGWRNHHSALQANGIQIEFACSPGAARNTKPPKRARS